jgi:hypothetical protein
MYQGRTIFAQLMSYLPMYEFGKCVARYEGDRYVKTFSCREQLLVMCFAQLTGRESLREVEVCLRALAGKLYHCGLQGPAARSTLAEANERRDERIYGDFAQVMMREARALYVGDDETLQSLRGAAYAFDSTTLDLCLSLFPWATFRTTKAGVKAHTLLDLRGDIPAFVVVTEAGVHDVNLLDVLPVEAGACYVMDRGYVDFGRLHALDQARGYFITRAKSNMAWRRLYSRPVDKTTGLRCDQIIRLTGRKAKKNYPECLRRVKFYDEPSGKTYIFLTNNFTLDALLIAQLYKHRWQVETFFRWIKQHLRIKAFFGRSRNAVCTQIWIGLCVYLLLAIVKKQLKSEHSFYTLLQIFSVTLFEKKPINEVLTDYKLQIIPHENCNQLSIF